MDLAEKMLKMWHELWRPGSEAAYWLLHADDFNAIDDLTKREQKESRYHPGDGVYMRGIRCAKSLLADKGKPMLAFVSKD